MQNVAGYTFQEILDASHPEVEHWRGVGNQGAAEIFLVPQSWKERVSALPKKWSSFCDFDVQPFGGKLAVIVPGFLHSDLYTLHSQIGTKAAVVFAWHIASALAVLHDSGSAHGMLHARSMGLDEDGQLSIRPALMLIEEDPDSNASAQATDCWQLAGVLEALIGEKNIQSSDERIRLLVGGLRQERSNIRLQPARALRQSLVAIAESNPDWEKELKSILGNEWGMDMLPPIEHSIIPKLYPQRPRARLPQGVEFRDYNPWSSPFVSQKDNPIEAPKKISFPSSIPTENKIRLPIPTRSKVFTEEEVDLLEPEEQTIAQIRLPFASVNPDVAVLSIGDQELDSSDDDIALVQEDTYQEKPKPVEIIVLQEKIHVQPSVHVDLVVDDPSEEILSEESLEEDVQEVFEVGSEESLEEFSGDASKEEPEDLDDEMVASLDINLMIEESLGLSQEESYEEEPSNNTNEDDSQQDQETQEVLILPNHEDQTPRIILDPPKTSVLVEEEESEETIDGGDEQSVIAVEAAVERRKLEQVEEVLLPEHQQVPIQESLVEEVPPVVPEFFEESEEQDIDSLESYEEDPDLEYSQDEESFLSQDEQKIAEPEDDFLSSIFNERDVQDLEVSASSRVSSIIVPVNEQKKVEEPLFVEQKSVDVLSEQVAGFEFSFDDSESERPVAQQTVQDSINAAFEKTNRDNISIDVIPGEQPRWMSAKSITANPHREDELGSGKWGEAQSNLDQDILQEVMSSTPVRELDLDDDGNGWALLLVGIVGLGLVILMLYGFVSSL
ncbi:MAG: hypothetical protein CL916_14325 [Deltaproteobacteria bacterium]|nr:hypothetical protein [Deltaproteobacteria bacterium]